MFRAPITLMPEKPLHLKCGLPVHSRRTWATEVEQEWQLFAQKLLRQLLATEK
jgi:hypothetical protein